MGKQVFILRVEGYATPGDPTGSQLALCAPAAPDYGGANYIAGVLGSLPRLDGVSWNMGQARVSDGRVRWVIRDQDAYPNALFAPRPIALTDEAVDASETAITLNKDCGDLGLAAGELLFCGLETWAVASESGQTVTVVRGAGDSIAVEHPDRARVYAYPPTVLGRRFSVSIVDRYGATANDEVVIAKGYVQEEPVCGVTLVADWQGITGIGRGVLIDDVDRISVSVQRTDEGPPHFGVPFVSYDTGASPTVFDSRYSDDGAMLYLEKSGVVVRWEDNGGSGGFVDTRAAVWGDLADVLPKSTEETAVISVRELAWSGDSRYSPFGYITDPSGSPTTVTTDHPCDIALNLLLSTAAGTNYSGSTSWDMGGKLAPHAALGADIGDVDTSAFTSARDGDLAGVRARNYWLGGESTDIGTEMRRLFGPLGYTVAVQLDGTITLLYLRDQYPGQGTTLDSDDLAAAANWSFGAISHPLNSVVVEVGTGPDGRGGVDLPIDTEDADRYYPTRRVKVGGTERWKASPYHWEDASGSESPLVRLAKRRLRRGSTRVATARLRLGAAAWQSVALGDFVNLDHSLLPKPSTGTAGITTPLSGFVTSYRPDVGRRTADIEVVVGDDSGRTALWAPSATVAT